MAKSPKKRNKKYNPRKVTPLNLQYVASPAEYCGFDTQYLRPLRPFCDDLPFCTDIPEDEFFDPRTVTEELGQKLYAWREPRCMAYSSRPEHYRNVLIDCAQMYAKMLHIVLELPRAEIEPWFEKEVTGIMNAWETYGRKKPDEAVL